MDLPNSPYIDSAEKVRLKISVSTRNEAKKLFLVFTFNSIIPLSGFA